MVLVTLATWTVRGLRTIPPISRGKSRAVKGGPERFWLQIAGEIAEKSFTGKGLRQKTVRNSGLYHVEHESGRRELCLRERPFHRGRAERHGHRLDPVRRHG